MNDPTAHNSAQDSSHEHVLQKNATSFQQTPNNFFISQKFGIPSDEKLIAYYWCAVSGNGYGWLYITENYICFEPLIWGRNTIVISFQLVVSLKKSKSNRFLDDAIDVETKNPSNTFRFSMFRQRDETFALLEQLWQISMARILKWAEVEKHKDQSYEINQNFIVKSSPIKDILSENRQLLSVNFHLRTEQRKAIESELKTIPSHNLTMLVDKTTFQQTLDNIHNGSNHNNHETIGKKHKEIHLILPELSLNDNMIKIVPEETKFVSTQKILLDFERRNEHFQKTFRLPSTETLLQSETLCNFWYKNTYRKGHIYVSRNFLCYKEIQDHIKFVIPWRTVMSISRERTTLSLFGNAIKVATESSIFYFTISRRNETYELWISLWKAAPALKNCTILNDNAKTMKLGDDIIKNSTHFSKDYVKYRQTQQEQWAQYFIENGIGASLILAENFSSLVRQGIGDYCRGYIWKISSGALYKALVDVDNYFELLKNYKGQQTVHVEVIEKDLHRTLPEHPYFQTSEGINALRNVLTAYSWKNPIIGYCQAMNFVCAILLLFMDEESAFWTLHTICEDFVPEYYRPTMMGSLIDQRIFEYLMNYYLPDVSAHLIKLSLPISLISIPWFLSLFIGFVPLEVSLRIMDCFFLEGTDILFRVGLALFKLSRNMILKANQSEDVLFLMKNINHTYSVSQLIEAIFGEWIPLPTQEINLLRRKHKYEIITTMKDDTQRKKIQQLVDMTKFTQAEVETLYKKFHSSIKVEDNNLMSFNIFKSLFPQIFPFWKHFTESSLPQLLFKIFDVNNDAHLDVKEFVVGMCKVYKGTLKERFLCMF